MRGTLKLLGLLTVATASCFLAYLTAAFVVLEAPELVLATLTDVHLEGFEFVRTLPLVVPRVLTRFPDNGSAALHALYQGGFLLSSALLLFLGVRAARRTHGWPRMFSVHTVFWAVVLVLLFAGLFVAWSRGPLGRLLQVLWPTGASSTWLRFSVSLPLILSAGVAGSVSLRPLLESAARSPAGRLAALAYWLVVPAGLVTGSLLPYVFSWREVLRWSFALWVVLGVAFLPLLMGVPTALRRSRSAPPLKLSRGGAIVLLGTFGLVLAALANHNEIIRFSQRGDFSEVQTTYWRLYTENDAPIEPDAWAANADQRLASMAKRLRVKAPNPHLVAYLHSSADTKQRFSGDDEPFTLDFGAKAVHHLLTPGGRITDPRGDALLLMHSAWGRPSSEAVAQALARYAVGSFHGTPLADYAARITREEEPHRLSEILLLETDYLSPLVRDALGGAWVELLVERYGPEILSGLYRAPLEAGKEIEFAAALQAPWKEVEREWHDYLLALAERADPPSRTGPEPYFHRGVSFSHEFGGNWGYGSDRARQELGRIRKLGANTIAVVPYAFTRAPQENRIYFRTDETDARVLRTIQAARQLGLRVMLKPQLWSRGFTGDIAFQDNGEFEHWFAQYRRWLLHFARLAELHEVDLLVIGTELDGVTSHETAWRALIDDIRRIYSGPLTYAAHWGSEFEALPFWDTLDYLGLNMYYPLAAPGETPRAESPQVKKLIGKFAALAEKHGKPILFTEVGYPALATAAAEPWKEGGAPLDPALQERCYLAVFQAFYEQPWFAGLYWWKWPSHGRGGRYHASYSPLGKPAAEVLHRWYGASRAREEIGGPPQTRYTHPRKRGNNE